MTQMEETEEAVRALFFLQTSPVIAPSSYGAPGEDLMAFRLPEGSYIHSEGKESKSLSIGQPAEQSDFSLVTESSGEENSRFDDNLKPGSALLALLNLNRLCTFDSSFLERHESSDDDESSSDGEDEPATRASKPEDSPRQAALTLEQMTNRGRSLSVSTVRSVERRFERLDTFNVGVANQPPPLGVGKVGLYSRDERRKIIDRFIKKRERRIWRKRVKYDVRKSFADSRLRVKGRFVRKEDEDQLRDLLVLTF